MHVTISDFKATVQLQSVIAGDGDYSRPSPDAFFTVSGCE